MKLNEAVEPFTVGELFLADSNSTTMNIMSNFLDNGGADGAFAFPMQSALVKVFRVSAAYVLAVLLPKACSCTVHAL